MVEFTAVANKLASSDRHTELTNPRVVFVILSQWLEAFHFLVQSDRKEGGPYVLSAHRGI